MDSQLARVEFKAKYVAFPWMVECEVNGYDEVYDAGIWFSQTDRDKWVVGVQLGDDVVHRLVDGKHEPVHGICHSLSPIGVVQERGYNIR